MPHSIGFISFYIKRISPSIIAFVSAISLPLLFAVQSEPAPGAVDTGTTAWMLISTALVLFMVPGLAMFYGGLV